MKKILFFLLITLIVSIPVSCYAINLESEFAILMDYGTGKILHEKNSTITASPASLTKLMTLLLTFEAIEKEKISLDSEVIISNKSAQMGGTQLFLEPNEIRTVEELIYATLIESANDAATALAEAIGGSFENFIIMMNERAKSLSLKNTNFVNSCGLDEEKHYTCAYDVAIIARELLKYEEIFKYSTTWTIDIYIGKNNDVLRTLVNTNKLIAKENYIDGLKTGYTETAGCCVCLTSEKNGLRLISVIMNAPSSDIRFSEGAALLEYGYSNFQAFYCCKVDEILGNVPLYNANTDYINFCAKENIYILDSINSDKEIDTTFELKNNVLFAPIKKGQFIGEAIFEIDGKEFARTSLFVSENVDKISFIDYLNKISDCIFSF